LESGEFEDFTAEWYEEAIEMGMLPDDERQEGGYSEVGFRNFNENPAVMKGKHKYGNTVAYCKAVNDIKVPKWKPSKQPTNDNCSPNCEPGDDPKLADFGALNAPKWQSLWGKPHEAGVDPKDQAPGSNVNYGTHFTVGSQSNALAVYNEIKGHCKTLNKKMNARKRACTKFLMTVTYNPRYKNLVGPITQKQIAKGRYCKKITKMRNPWRYCKASCTGTPCDPMNKKDEKNPCINASKCNRKKWMCNIMLNEFWKNMSWRWKDRSGIPCRELPKQFKGVAPPSDHPINDNLRCGPVVCDWIPGSEQPWCTA